MNSALECPQCGAAGSQGQKKCIYCGCFIIFSKLTDIQTDGSFDFTKASLFLKKNKSNEQDYSEFDVEFSIGLLYLKQKAFPLALSQFSKLIDKFPDEPNPYLYKAASMTEGKKPRILNLARIKEMSGLFNLAKTLSQDPGIIYALQSIIEYDYFVKNSLKPFDPSPIDQMNEARKIGFDFDELMEFLTLINLKEGDVKEVLYI